MSIFEKDAFNHTRHGAAVERIRNFCAGRRTLVAFSGGKDSQCCYHLCEEAGIDFHAEYSITRFEPPDLLGFIREHYPKVTFRRAYRRSLMDDITQKGLPNRFARWCCEAKHKKTEGFDIVALGIRWEESAARRETWRMFGFKQDRTAYVCPIIDWTEDDVWEYLAGRPRCPLYDEGMRRIGCVMCPLAPNAMVRQSERWPRTAAMLRKGAGRFVARMRSKGFVTGHGKPCADWCRSPDPEGEYWARWLATGQTSKPIGDCDKFEDELCLFAGTGFDEKDGVTVEDNA